MKKRTKVLLSVIGIFGIIILPDFNMHYQNITLKLDQLPNAYKSYSALANLKDDTYEVLDFLSREPVLQLNDSTIAIVADLENENNNGDSVRRTWYKVNLKGVIRDSLVLGYTQGESKHFYKTFNNYIVDIEANTYNTWLIDSDATSKPIENLHPTKIYSSAEVEKVMLVGNYVFSTTIQSEKSEGDDINKLIFYRNKSFHIIHMENSWTTVNDPGSKLQVKYEASDEGEDKRSAIIKRVYLHKEKWIDTSFWNLSERLTKWTGGGAGRKRWEGTAYFDLQLPKKTLHYTQPVTIDYPDQYVRADHDYSVYSPADGDYALLNEGQYFAIYLIRPKITNRK